MLPPVARFLLVAAFASLLVCVTSLWAAEVGVAINLGLLAAVWSMDREVTAVEHRQGERIS